MLQVRKETVPAGAELNKYLSITMAGEVYGIPVGRIKEILEYSEVTPVPMMPPYVRGAINLRGRGVPVVDLALRFGKGATTVGRRSCIVIVEGPATDSEQFDVGLLVDAVNEVVDIAPSEIESAPSFGGRVRTDFLSGMGKVKGKFILLLSLDRLLEVESTDLGVAALTQGDSA